MRRFRRNQQLIIGGGEEASKAPDRYGIRGLYPLGLVVNPRDNEPLIVVTDEEYVGVRSLRADGFLFKHGAGYFDTTGHGKSKEAENLTGFPRAHTPGGVAPRGRGYGTSLYTALTLGAYLKDNGHADIQMDVEGEGISSESEGRSSDADAWWDAAHSRGLTEREQTEGDEETEEYVKLNVDADELEGCVSVDDDKRITYVNEVNVDLTSPGDSLDVDTYRYWGGSGASGAGAWGHRLVPLELTFNSQDTYATIPDDIRAGSELRFLVELAIEDPDILGDASPESLLALDVRGLHPDAINLLSLAYMAADLGDREVDQMLYRYEHGLDPSEKGPEQARLFSANARAAGLADVLEARRLTGWSRLKSLP